MVAPKIEKMACQRSMAQRKKREKGLSMSQKKRGDDKRESANVLRSKSHPSIHQDWMTCFSMDPLFDFTIYGMQVCPVFTLP